MVCKSLSFVTLAATLAFCVSGAAPPEVKRFTAYTRPLGLSQGEVTNAFHKLAIPKGPIAVYRFEADVVEKDADGNVIPVPIYDAYLHHHVVGSNHKTYAKVADQYAPMKPAAISRSVGFGAGTECRGTPQEFYHPYAFVTVEGEDEWVANVHIINTRKLPTEKAHRCLECPCTSEDKITENSVNGLPFRSNACNAELRAENNTVCAATTYHGGLRCCEDASFCLEKEELGVSKDSTSTYFLRYTIEYSDVQPDVRPLYLAGCCDATGDFDNHGNVEYDIPPCDPEIHPGCVHTLSTRQRLNVGTSSVYSFAQDGSAGSNDVELVFAVGHQHRGGLGISIYNDATGDLICSSVPKYGKGEEIGNEKDYVVAMSTCTFNPPLRFKATDVIRIVSLYNNTLPHTGAMSLMYLAVSDVQSSAAGAVVAAAKASEQNASAGESGLLPSSFIIGGCIAVAVIAVGVVMHKKKRHGYIPLARPN